MAGSRRFLKLMGIVVAVTVVTSAATVWAVNAYFFPKAFKPVELSQKEQEKLDWKISQFQSPSPRAWHPPKKPGEPLAPERYSEVGAKREIEFTERELNALIARNTDLADKLAIDLSQDMASAKLIVPIDPEFPFFGGKTLKVTAGLEMRYGNGKPVVIIRGVSFWGVPVPDAWMGNLKNVDLVKEFGDEKGFWKGFSEGVDNITVEDGYVRIKLKA